MSMILFGNDVLFQQRFLKAAGFYTGELDGDWGPLTDGAMTSFEKKSREITAALGTFDSLSERSILTLNPKAQEAARAFLKKVRAADIGDIRIVSGTRTYAEQNALYRKGRFGNPPPVVTKAKGGQSNHNFGIAWDIGIFRNGQYLDKPDLYERAARAGLVDSLEWGGDWKSFKDLPHFQLATGNPIKLVCAKFENGQAYV